MRSEARLLLLLAGVQGKETDIFLFRLSLLTLLLLVVVGMVVAVSLLLLQFVSLFVLLPLHL